MNSGDRNIPSECASAAGSGLQHVSVAPFLLNIPEEVLARLAHRVDLAALLRLYGTCTTLQSWLTEARALAKKSWLSWLPELTFGAVTLSDQGQTATMIASGANWVVGRSLPTTGRSSWRVRINQCHQSQGGVLVGVCHEASCLYGPWKGHAWALDGANGKLIRRGLKADPNTAKSIQFDNKARPPTDFPDGDQKNALVGAHGMSNLWGKANGATITVTFDASAGTLFFQFNGDEEMGVVAGFPSGTAMRPWVFLNYVADSVSVCFLDHDAPKIQ